MEVLAKMDHDRRVSFGFAHTREYTVTIGDHPSVTKGPPVQLDWQFEETYSAPIVELEMYEKQQAESYPRPVKTLSSHKRLALVQASGVSKAQIKKTLKEVDSIRTSRRKSNKHLDSDLLKMFLREEERRNKMASED